MNKIEISEDIMSKLSDVIDEMLFDGGYIEDVSHDAFTLYCEMVFETHIHSMRYCKENDKQSYDMLCKHLSSCVKMIH